jgi:hypothetical protein
MLVISLSFSKIARVYFGVQTHGQGRKNCAKVKTTIVFTMFHIPVGSAPIPRKGHYGMIARIQDRKKFGGV